jgi:hypothetical protein
MPATSSVKSAPSFGTPARNRSIGGGIMGGVLAAIIGLAVVVIVGTFFWSAVVGMRGPVIAGVVGVVAGASIRQFGHPLIRCFAAGVGAAVGGFFAVAAAEQSTPGTLEWAVNGSLLGVLFGASCAAAAALAIGAAAAAFPRRTSL